MDIRSKLKGKTIDEELRFLYRVNEILRLEHNAEGTKFRDGVITEAQWDVYKQGFRARQKRILGRASAIRKRLGLDKVVHGTAAEELAARDRSTKHKREGSIASRFDGEIDIKTIE